MEITIKYRPVMPHFSYIFPMPYWSLLFPTTVSTPHNIPLPAIHLLLPLPTTTLLLPIPTTTPTPPLTYHYPYSSPYLPLPLLLPTYHYPYSSPYLPPPLRIEIITLKKRLGEIHVSYMCLCTRISDLCIALDAYMYISVTGQQCVTLMSISEKQIRTWYALIYM